MPPWERYATQGEAPAAGPWAKYAQAPQSYEEAVASPEGQQLVGELRTKAGELRDEADRTFLKNAGAESPAYAWITSSANTAATKTR